MISPGTVGANPEMFPVELFAGDEEVVAAEVSPRPKLYSVNRSAAGIVCHRGPHATRKASSAVVVSSLK
ncbi:MAG TPA: hypothetical protein VF333_10530, partial [Pyrinomonadaceae bacterium]